MILYMGFVTKDDLLEGIDQIGPRILVQNKFVDITITEFNNEYILESFYNKNRKIKGLARCALFFLLKELLDGKVIYNNTILKVDTLMPSDGNIDKLIAIYESVGFTKEINNRYIIMYSTIEHLMNILSSQCNHFMGGTKPKRSKLKKKKTKSIH